MGSRNFDLGARDMKSAGRIALEEGMRRSIAWCLEAGLLEAPGGTPSLALGSGSR